MKNLKRMLFTNWGAVRLMRVIISTLIIYMAFTQQNWLVGILGALIFYQAVTNTGCCTNNCTISQRRYQSNNKTI